MSTSVPPPGWGEIDGAGARPGAGKRRTLLVSVAVVAALAGTAFAVSALTSSPLSPLAQAATASANAPGFRMHMTLQMSSSTLSSPITATADGVFDEREHAASISLAVDFGNDPRFLQALGSGVLRMQMVMRGTAVYAQLPPALTKALPTSGKPWVKLDLARLTSIPGLSSLMNSSSAVSPDGFLQVLRSVSGGVVDLGPQAVDGVETTHYRAQLDMTDLVNAMPAAQRQLAQRALALIEQTTHVGGFPLDVFIDAHRLVRRIGMTLSLGLPTGASMQETMTADLSDYGSQPEPALPPSNQVQDLSTLSG